MTASTADQTIAPSDARLAGILSIAADAIISIDERQRIILFNQGAEQIFGYAPDEVMGQPLERLMPERFRATHAQHIESFAKTGTASRRMGDRQQIWALHKSGREFPAEASISKLDIAGARTFTVVLRDITTRVQRERELELSEQRLMLALEAGDIGLFEIDHTTGAHYWSQIHREILGVTADEPASMQRLLAMVPPEDRKAVETLFERNQDSSGDGRLKFQHRIIRADGEMRWLAREWRTSFVGEGVARRALHTVGVIRDITERKQLEVQLEQRVSERTAELTALVDALPDGIAQADNAGRLIACNAGMTRLFGYRRRELIGLAARDLYASAADFDAVVAAAAAWEAGERFEAVTIECHRRDATSFTAMVLGNVVRDGDGQIVSRVWIFRDISDELKRQRALNQSQRMEAFGQLTGGIAHDFNNLLTVISGNQELLEMRLKDNGDLALLKRAQEAADMGARLTARLLTFARRRPLAPTELDLNGQISGMVELLRRSIGDDVSLTTNLAPHLPLVRADASEIENALLNLAINARDAMSNGGTILIETSVHTVVGQGSGVDGKLMPGDYVRLSVSDTGSGMTPDVLARACEPFFTTKPPGKGTGLGLSSIYGAFRQLGGTIEIYSVVGRGTTVDIFLPRAEGKGRPTAAHHNAEIVPMSAGEAVLLVEDNSAVREVASRRLDGLGYKVQEVETGAAAIELLQQPGVRFDLVFSDVVMPGGMSGYDVAEWVGANAPGTRMLLTSGDPGAVSGGTRIVQSTVRMLRKPYSRAELARAVRDALDD